MHRNTNHAGTKRRSHNNESGEKRQIVYYRCNNPRHIARNCRTPDDKLNEHKKDVPICQLCNNFGHIARFYKMDRKDLNRNQNYRRNNRRNEVKDQPNELNESFVKEKEPKISYTEDVPEKKMKSLIVNDSSHQD